jgi:hypothetical protein
LLMVIDGPDRPPGDQDHGLVDEHSFVRVLSCCATESARAKRLSEPMFPGTRLGRRKPSTRLYEAASTKYEQTVMWLMIRRSARGMCNEMCDEETV